MFKLECNARENIIDFIERSEKLPFMRAYYSFLRGETTFEKNLKAVAKLNQRKDSLHLLTQGKSANSFVYHIKSHLELAGFKLLTTARKKADHLTFILSEPLSEKDISFLSKKTTQKPNAILFLLQKQKGGEEIFKKLINCEVMDFIKQENYYFNFFLMLKKLFPNLNLDKIIAEFTCTYKEINSGSRSLDVYSKQQNLKGWPTNKIRLSLISAFLMAAVVGSGFLISWNNQKNNEDLARSELILPKEAFLLNRPELITQINKKLEKQEEASKP